MSHDESTSAHRPRVLWVTDFDYPAQGRNYGAEDRWLIDQLRRRFGIATIDPREAPAAVDDVDLVVVRNSGPVSRYAEAHAEFRERVQACGVPVYNELNGRADMLGKRYLLEMHEQGMPVIPTAPADRADRLPEASEFVVKPVHGADSVGIGFVDAAGLRDIDQPDMLIQPRVQMLAEISFVFVDDRYHYAVSTSPGRERWQLHEYEASAEDLAFARRMIAWNDIEHGVQRVDACRIENGSLLLVELEDLNPYLSLDVIATPTRDRFVESFARALDGTISAAGQSARPDHS